MTEPDALSALASHVATHVAALQGRDTTEVLMVIIGDQQAAVIYSRFADGERFEGLDLLGLTDGGGVEVTAFASAANGTPPEATPPTLRRTSPGRDPTAEDAGIALVKRFYIEVFGQADQQAVDRLVTEGYIQHNPWIAQGRSGLRALVAAGPGPSPLDGLGAGGVFADGDMVVHVSHLPFGDGMTLVDVFRVEGDFLAEHWDFTPLGTTLPAPPGAAS
jgi:predicted SnoaL-like aldol condensation-catalyzing enzyme